MSGSNERILLVDDDLDFLEMAGRILADEGYEVAKARGPEEALSLIAAERPALVVTDLMMSALDAGFSLARALKGNPATSDLPVVVVSAIAGRLRLDFSPAGPADLEAMNADAYFEKPLVPARFLKRVRELLNRADREAAP